MTVPAYFNEQQRGATLMAAQMAGIPRVQLLQGDAHDLIYDFS